MYKQPQRSEHETLQRIWDIEDIKNLMSRRSYLLHEHKRKEELETLWVREPEHRETASLGSNWGFYTGMDSIERYYVEQHAAQRRQRLVQLQEKYPALSEQDINIGISTFRCLNTPYVVVADDGQTARGRWYMTGEDTVSEPDRSGSGYWWCWVIGADFVLESGEWKLWHLVQAQDFYCPVSKAFRDLPDYNEPGSDPGEIAFGQPDIAFLAHDNRYVLNDNWPPIPMSYASFSEQTSYGPEGHPGLNKNIESLEWATEVASKRAWGR